MLTKKLIFAVMFVLMMVAGAVQAGGDAARGLELSENCSGCHGDDGMGDEDNPKIAGLDAAKHVELLTGYKTVDESGMMMDYVVDLSDQDMADLAAYYATLGGE